MIKRLLLSLALVGGGLGSGHAQVLDPTFQHRELRQPLRSWRPSADQVRLVRQPDGRIIVGTSVDFVNGTPVPRLLRLLPDGSLDPSFNAGAGANGSITALVLQPDGKVLVGGEFKEFNRTPTSGVVRLLPDGSLDPTFAAPPIAEVSCLALQPDGKVLVSNHRFQSSITRLLPNGQVDSTFHSIDLGGSFSGAQKTRALLVQADGKIVVGGGPFAYAQSSGLARLLPDGTVDPAFSGNVRSSVSSIAQQPDGKLVVGGTFTYQLPNRARTTLQGLVRLLPGGQPDTTFTPVAGADAVQVNSLFVEPNGDVVVGGRGTPTGASTYIGFLARFDAGGASISSGTSGPSGTVETVLSDGAGGQLAGGFFDTFAGQPCTGLVQVLPGGGLAPNFRPVLESRGLITACHLLPGEEILAYGLFSWADGVPMDMGRLYPWRFQPDGRLDTAFRSPFEGFLLGNDTTGAFFLARAGVAATDTSKLVRCLPNGTVDRSFQHPAWGRFSMLGMQTMTNGDLLVYGVPPTNPAGAPGIYRLPAGGSTTPIYAVGRRTRMLVRQPNDDLIVLDDSLQIMRIVRRFGATGQRDASFRPQYVWSSPRAPRLTMLMQPTTGQVVVNAEIMVNGGQTLPQTLNRLTTTGEIDTTFRVSGNYWLRAMQPDGKMIVSTLPDSSNTTLRRLLPNGREDATFVPVPIPQGYADGYLEGVRLYADGRLLLYGSFGSVAGQPRYGLARLTLNPNGLPEAAARPALTLFPNPAHHRVTISAEPTAVAQPVRVVDALGRTVRTARLEPRTSHLDLPLEGLAPGIYTVRVGAAARRLVVE